MRILNISSTNDLVAKRSLTSLKRHVSVDHSLLGGFTMDSEAPGSADRVIPKFNGYYAKAGMSANDEARYNVSSLLFLPLSLPL